jgi:hypothetical protein
MSIYRTVKEIYGLRVPDETDWLLLDEDPGQCCNNGQVGYFRAGAYDRNMMFLALRWREVAPGDYTYHSGEKPNASKFVRDHWNSDLRAEADRLGLEIIEGPGWFTIPSEG